MTRSILTLLALSLITLGCSNEGTMSATSNDATAVADPADVGPGEPAAADGDLAAAPLDNDATSSTSASASASVTGRRRSWAVVITSGSSLSVGISGRGGVGIGVAQR